MREEKHQEVLKEMLDEIESASKDPEGLLRHQRRLAFSVSLGAATLIELYFHKLNIMKEGSRINHRWFKRKLSSIKEQLENQITSPIDTVKNINKIIEIAREIEVKRDDLAYGAPAGEDILQEKINLFFKLKELTKC